MSTETDVRMGILSDDPVAGDGRSIFEHRSTFTDILLGQHRARIDAVEDRIAEEYGIMGEEIDVIEQEWTPTYEARPRFGLLDGPLPAARGTDG